MENRKLKIRVYVEPELHKAIMKSAKAGNHTAGHEIINRLTSTAGTKPLQPDAQVQARLEAVAVKNGTTPTDEINRIVRSYLKIK